MPSLQDIEYLRMRANEERQRASEATDSKVRQVHLDLALRYEMASGSHNHIQSTRDAISRSFALLSQTSDYASD